MACFFGCVVLTGWLWQRQGQLPNSVGEVEAVRIEQPKNCDKSPLTGYSSRFPSHKLD